MSSTDTPLDTKESLASAMAEGALINMTAINQALAPIKLDAAGLAQLGFEPVATAKAAKLYWRSDLPAMRAALIVHLTNCATPAEDIALARAFFSLQSEQVKTIMRAEVAGAESFAATLQ